MRKHLYLLIVRMATKLFVVRVSLGGPSAAKFVTQRLGKVAADAASSEV
jgi:hypothetical protein